MADLIPTVRRHRTPLIMIADALTWVVAFVMFAWLRLEQQSDRVPWGHVLALGAVAAIPLFPIAPFFTGAVWFSMARYYRSHKRSHQDPAWAKENMPWHVDHHMGTDQNSNWCVTHPWFDYVMKTRKPYSEDPSGALPEGAKGGLLSRMWAGLQEGREAFKAKKAPAQPVQLRAVS